jgi:hypothetical protein
MLIILYTPPPPRCTRLTIDIVMQESKSVREALRGGLGVGNSELELFKAYAFVRAFSCTIITFRFAGLVPICQL